MSSGSACTSASLEPSYVLRALGVEEDMAHTSIRWVPGGDTLAASLAAHLGPVPPACASIQGVGRIAQLMQGPETTVVRQLRGMTSRGKQLCSISMPVCG